jgi:Na+-transporting NADH:ubiquinone oxidoreductase subunit F
MRLGCQVQVRSDVRIIVPEGLFAVRTFRGVVERLRDLTYDIRELRIRLVEPEAIEFVPGQYVQLEMPPAVRAKGGPGRAYSMSSPPEDSGYVELIIRLVPGGICTTWVFSVLKEGDEVKFSGPYGRFRMSDSRAEMIWIAGGSGMAPFWSLVRHMKHRNIVRPCTYFFGAVGKRDLFLVEEFRRLEKELPSFRFVPALSGPKEGEGWSGERGLITDVLDRHLADGAGKEAYLCGSPGMIDAARKVLDRKGVAGDRIFYDKFA